MDWALIIGPLISGLLAKIFSQCDESVSSQDPVEYLVANYDRSTGEFSRPVMQAAIRQTRKAINHAKKNASRQDRKSFPKYSRDNISDIAYDKLYEAMTASATEVRAAFTMAAMLSDGDD